MYHVSTNVSFMVENVNQIESGIAINECNYLKEPKVWWNYRYNKKTVSWKTLPTNFNEKRWPVKQEISIFSLPFY